LARFLGLDYGDKTIGVAVSDPLGTMALGVETIRRNDEKSLKISIGRLRELVKEYHPVGCFVLGFPKNMDGSQGERCAKTLAFKAKLEKNFKNIPVKLWDERLSTAGARRTLMVPTRDVIDEMAAVFILQGYMDSLKKRGTTVMTEFNDDHVLTMVDEEGNELGYNVLATKETENDGLYMLVEEDAGEEATESEVLIFKCMNYNDSDQSEMVFEQLDEDHADLETGFELFKEDFEALGIEH